MLAEVAKKKGLSLCGIQRNQTTASFYGRDLGPTDAILLASDLSQAIVTASLTLLDVRHNSLDEEGEAVLRKAVEGRSGFKLEL